MFPVCGAMAGMVDRESAICAQLFEPVQVPLIVKYWAPPAGPPASWFHAPMAAVCHMAEEPAPSTLTTVFALATGAVITAAANAAADRSVETFIRDLL
jgi:hypothetical protein